VCCAPAGDVAEIEDGIGPKLPQSMMSLSSTIAGIVVAFVNNWKLSLLTMGFIPAMAIVGGAIHTVRWCRGGDTVTTTAAGGC